MLQNAHFSTFTLAPLTIALLLLQHTNKHSVYKVGIELCLHQAVACDIN